MERLLKEWDLPELFEKCKSEEVTLETLHYLNETLITELVPRIGPRSKFLHHWRKWKKRDGGGDIQDEEEMESEGRVSTPKPNPTPSPIPARQYANTQLAQVEPQIPPMPDGNFSKEVNVTLEGKLSYDSSGWGWLSASGNLSPSSSLVEPSSSRSAEGGNFCQVKAEPEDGSLPESENPASSPGPKFLLQGRISFRSNELSGVPSFILGEQQPINATTSYNDLSDESCTWTPLELSQQFSSLEPATSSYSPGFPIGTPPQHCSATSTTTSSTRRKRGRSEGFDLLSLLNSTSKGKMVLSTYRSRGSLDGPARQNLTDLIIAEELREDFDKRITSHRFQEIASAIVELFPSENEDTYFACDRNDGDRPLGKGKLSSKYYNTRRQLAKSGVLSKGGPRERRQGNALVTFLQSATQSDEEKSNLEWFLTPRNITTDEETTTALRKWCSCWKLRMLKILSPGYQPIMYLEEFPILRNPIASDLILGDFWNIYRDATTRLIQEWPVFCEKVISILSEDYRKQLPLLEQIKKEPCGVGREVGALLLLPNLCPVATCKGTGDLSELWRPTRQESQDGFLLHVETMADVQPALETFWMRMTNLGQPVCPLPIIVGRSLHELEAAMVAIDPTTTFPVSNALTAVDLAFKCFHALQAPYPPQAQNVWLFLQHAVYRIATPGEKLSVIVTSLLADFGIRPIPPVTGWDQILTV